MSDISANKNPVGEVILASASPRRRELLEQIGVTFRICVSDADEQCDIKEPEMLVRFLSEKKAESVFEQNPEAIVIAADTVVYLEGEGIMGKPKDDADAYRMISNLSGKANEVYTGVTVRDRNGAETFAVKTKVYFKALSDSEIRDYVASGECSDKAGAYAIQGRACVFIEKIDGDYFNVVGLPLSPLYDILKKKGVIFWASLM
ncbi:MAG: septum formation inhibitor Maf [Ruminococcaceae bacterium]|nr:septum formation inhibitor Maf [Oscillospiraceae bacterium]